MIKKAVMAAILDFGSERFKLFFNYKSPQLFLPSDKSIGDSVQEMKQKKKTKKKKKMFKRPSWPSNRNDFSYPIYKSPQCFLYIFRVNWPFGSGQEMKIRFSIWPHFPSD